MSILQQCWKTLNISLIDNILTVSMNRPKVNAMSIDLLNDLINVFDHASKHENVKGVHLRSSFNTFSAGIDLVEMHERCAARQRPAIDKFVYDILKRGVSAPLYCPKPVACSLDGHAIAGGLILALACDHISMGIKRPFRVGLTELPVGVPFPSTPMEIVRNRLDPQVAHRLIFDGNVISSNDFPIRCERSETPDVSSLKWLKMVIGRPLEGFAITKKRWWSNVTRLDLIDNEKEKEEYFRTITGDDCLQAMKKMLEK